MFICLFTLWETLALFTAFIVSGAKFIWIGRVQVTLAPWRQTPAVFKISF